MDYIELEDIKDNIVIIKINKSYFEGISSKQLYEYTRGYWKRKISSLEGIEYCLSVSNGIVVEVYKIEGWYTAGSYPMETKETVNLEGRIEFIGEVAQDEIRNRYLNKSVSHLFKPGEANPLKTFFCKMDINKAYKPKEILVEDSLVKIICPNCDSTFIRSKRCPECGQLIDYD